MAGSSKDPSMRESESLGEGGASGFGGFAVGLTVSEATDGNQVPSWLDEADEHEEEIKVAYKDILSYKRRERVVMDIKEVSGDSNRWIEDKEITELVFGTMKINPMDVHRLMVNRRPGGVSTLTMKPGKDIQERWLGVKESDASGRFYELTKRRPDLTRITFNDVPEDVSDYEILHLARCYGVLSKAEVKWQKNKFGVENGVREVLVKLRKGKKMKTFYWMEGPEAHDRPVRIMVRYEGQDRQCFKCLKLQGECSAGGLGKYCKALDAEDMDKYRERLRVEDGYVSLKERYFKSLGRWREHRDRAQSFKTIRKDTRQAEKAKWLDKRTALEDEMFELLPDLQDKLVEDLADHTWERVKMKRVGKGFHPNGSEWLRGLSDKVDSEKPHCDQSLRRLKGKLMSAIAKRRAANGLDPWTNDPGMIPELDPEMYAEHVERMKTAVTELTEKTVELEIEGAKKEVLLTLEEDLVSEPWKDPRDGQEYILWNGYTKRKADVMSPKESRDFKINRREKTDEVKVSGDSDSVTTDTQAKTSNEEVSASS
jgi:hypothetical protein